MKARWSRLNRSLAWFHRWAGVGLCLLFAMWFASGAVLHFVGFPALSTQDRHRGGAPIDFGQIRVPPSQVLDAAAGARDLRLVDRGGRAAYLVEPATGPWTAFDAENGATLPDLSSTDARAIAGAFAGAAGTAAPVAATGPLAVDQWIVHQHFDPYRPFYRIRLNDAQRTDLYVSARTGEVLQRTRFAERAWNWAGAVVHWIYFTPLRQSWTAWNQVVWWTSLAALLSSAAGTWLGIVRMTANRAAGRRGLSPFRGWMRWHHLIGLFASVIVMTWMLSGWLSMDHGRVFSMGRATDEQAARLSGMPLADAARSVSPDSLQRMAPATEVDFDAVGGRPVLTAYSSRTGTPRVMFPIDGGDALPRIPDSLLLAGVKRVWPDAAAVAPASGAVASAAVTGADALYRHAESTGADAAGFTAEGGSLRVYVDPSTGRFLTVMDPSRRGYAWVYYGLHTLEFPGLIERPALRTALVLSLLTLGFVSSATGVVLSVKRLKREFA